MTERHATGRYRFGRLIWARLRSRTGKRELHPAIIISGNSSIIQPERFDPRKDFSQLNAVGVVGVSSEYRKYPPAVPLPFNPARGGHVTTKLMRDCGACIGWYDWVVLKEDVEGLGGDVPEAQMREISRLILEDFERKLTVKLSHLRKELADAHLLLAKIIQPPS